MGRKNESSKATGFILPGMGHAAQWEAFWRASSPGRDRRSLITLRERRDRVERTAPVTLTERANELAT